MLTLAATAVALALTTVPVPSPEPSAPPEFVPYGVTDRWLIPETWDYATTPYYTPGIFPQTTLDGVLPCGRWEQFDEYWIETPEEEILYLSLDDDGILTQGEDSAIYLNHHFYPGGDCVVPPVETPVVVPPVVVPPTVEPPVVCAEGETLAEDLTCVPAGYYDEPRPTVPEDVLAETGSNPIPGSVAAVLLFAAGGALVYTDIKRRRRATV